MEKSKGKLFFLGIQIFLMFALLYNKNYLLFYLVTAVFIHDSYSFYKDAKNRNQMLMVLKSLKGYRFSQRGVNILVPKEADITPLVYEINQLIDLNTSLKIEKDIQETNSKQLMSNLSHDIRTPLTSIIGYVDALNDGVVSSEEEVKSFIEILSMKSNNLKELTDQIFNIARIDAGDVAMNYESINLNEFLIHTLIDFMPQFEKNEMTLDNKLSEKPFMIKADRIALTRIFHNIIRNTLQHGKDSKIIGISSQKIEDFYRIIIWDKGKGIPKSKQAMIFERLYKVDDSRKIGSSNSGLGMAIAKKLVKKHNGKIYIQSKENSFTEFYVEFPIVKETLL